MNCRACGTPIQFVKLGNGLSPVEVEPHPQGNIRVSTANAEILKGDELAQAHAAGEPLRISHFATCPNAGSFRQRVQEK